MGAAGRRMIVEPVLTWLKTREEKFGKRQEMRSGAMQAFRCVLVLMLGLLASGSSSTSSPLAPPESTGQAEELNGLWEAKPPFGPDIRVSLRIGAGANGWRAEIAGRSTQAKVTGDAIAFELPGNG